MADNKPTPEDSERGKPRVVLDERVKFEVSYDSDSTAKNGNSLTASSGSSASDVPREIRCKETENCPSEENDNSVDSSATKAKEIKKCFDALEYFSKEVHSSFGDSSNSKGSDPPVDPPVDPNVVFEEIPEGNGNGGFVDVSFTVVIGENDVVDIINKLWTSQYDASKSSEDVILGNCKGLFEKDYRCETIAPSIEAFVLQIVDNYGGSLCVNYPVRLIVPVAKKTEIQNGSIKFEKNTYYQKVESSASSRCRARFVAPAILFDNKLICRSGTLSNRKAATYETATKAEPPQTQYIEDNMLDVSLRMASYAMNSIYHKAKSAGEAAMQLLNPNSMENLRGIDKEVLKLCNITWICDLMVEGRKMFLQTISVTSSEKVNTEAYDEFRIEKMPYPGCEFFKRYHYTSHNAKGLVFNWDRADVDTGLELTENPSISFPDIDWENYKLWDIISLTQNYLKILLSNLVKDTGGLLVHCISGWDRTTLMISLLRVSLWADGVVHESLNGLEMAYLTLAYDWYLFGHDFPSRLARREEIMHFCFNFLPLITSDEFSVTRMFHDLSPEQKAGRQFPEFVPGRRCFLENFSKLILSFYDDQNAQIVT